MPEPRHGAFVVSLDFEMHWGVFDEDAQRDSRPVMLESRKMVPRMLALFEEKAIAATWATVGFLFATTRAHLESLSPGVRPAYANPELDPYRVTVGEDEDSDPFHYAPSLVRQVMATPRQEIGTHTFSHYYAEEPGQTLESFRADLKSAVDAAREYGVEVSSIVFPRNQVNTAYLPVLPELGIRAYRGRDPRWMYRERSRRDRYHPGKRIARLVDRRVGISGYNLTRWRDVPGRNGLCNVPSTMKFWGYTEDGEHEWRIPWLKRAICRAALTGQIMHLWWHPQDVGLHQDRQMALLREILETVERYRDSHGLQSMSMSDVSRVAAAM